MNEYIIGQFPIKDLTNRFSDFGDSVIQDIKFSMADIYSNHLITLVLHAQDTTANTNILRGYVKVSFLMTDIAEFKIDYANKYNLQVISDVLNIVVINELIYLDFYEGYAETPEEFRKSRLYFVCRKCVVRVEPL